MNNKDKYKQLCEVEESIHIFNKGWWMDAVCGEENWDVVLVEQGYQIVGALPYYMTKGKWGLKQISMPKLTQTNGIWIKYLPNQHYSARLAHDKKVMYAIIEHLDSLNIDYFSQHFHYSVTNWLPFHWKGFRQTTRYTYVIDNLKDLGLVYGNFQRTKRQAIKKAEKGLCVKFDLPARDFYDHHKRSIEKQGDTIAYTFDLFNRIYSSAYQRDAGKVAYSVDRDNNFHSGLFVIWDRNSAYALISVVNPDSKSTGALPLLFREMIGYVSNKTATFDFEGSMMENIERSYRGLGGIQKPYFNISKTYSPSLMIRNGIKQINKGVKKTIAKAIVKPPLMKIR